MQQPASLLTLKIAVTDILSPHHLIGRKLELQRLMTEMDTFSREDGGDAVQAGLQHWGIFKQLHLLTSNVLPLVIALFCVARKSDS